MANAEHVALLKSGVAAWNEWRTGHPKLRPDLSKANLSRRNLNHANLTYANLSGVELNNARVQSADLRRADLQGAWLVRANLNNANLTYANLSGANLGVAELWGAKLKGANLRRAHLGLTSLYGSDLSQADLTEADLHGASLVDCKIDQANLTGCRVYGISVWDSSLSDAIQKDLVITPSEFSTASGVSLRARFTRRHHPDQPKLTLDNLEVAQFVYLLLNNDKIRDVIDTISSKVVLILGRFTEERKATLDALRDALRERNYLPILFDFEKPMNRDFTETVSTLAHLARFVVADLTDPRSIPQELTAIIPRLLSVPIRPMLLGSQQEWSMFADLTRYPHVIPPLYYESEAMLLGRLESHIIAPAEQRARELTGNKEKTGEAPMRTPRTK